MIFLESGNSLLGIAEQYDIPLRRLLEFNDIDEEDILIRSQLIFLQRKRKVGFNEFHVVLEGETLYDIAQEEGIRFESLIEYNHLKPGMIPATGQKLSLQFKLATRPVLAEEVMAVYSVQETVLPRTLPTGDVTRHVVQTKETLYSISKKYSVDVEKILEWNKLQGFELKIGQELVIHKN